MKLRKYPEIKVERMTFAPPDFAHYRIEIDGKVFYRFKKNKLYFYTYSIHRHGKLVDARKTIRNPELREVIDEAINGYLYLLGNKLY